LRLSMYKRIASADNSEELRALQVEMIDRFGLLPDAAKNLVRITELRNRAGQLGIRKIDGGPQGISLEFAEDTKVNPSYLIELIQTYPQDYKLEGPTRLRILAKISDTQERMKLVESVVNELAEKSDKNA